MTKAVTPRTPTRRSKRFQPLVTPSRAPDYPSDIIWSGLPVHIRPTDPELDLLDEERITWNKDEDDKEELETTFYEGFEKRRKPVKCIKRGKESATKAKTDDVERYQVGDTVLVSTFSFSKRKPPSIGLIVSMWETRPTDEEDESDEEKMRVRVHWFLRPSELASIRAKRDHAKNEIYFSVASSEILLPSSIVSHCTVTSHPPDLFELKSATAWTLSSTKDGPFLPDDSDTEGPDDNIKANFYCHLAVDSRRGLFYDFDWAEHHQQATSYPETEVGWGSGSAWDVDVADVRVPTSSRQRKKQKLNHPNISESESEGDHLDSEDEYQTVKHPSLLGSARGDDSDSSRSDFADGEEDENPEEPDDTPKTPSKKRKRQPATYKKPKSSSPSKGTITPRKPRATRLAYPTPHSKAALVQRTKKKQKLAVRPQLRPYAGNTVTQDLAGLPKDPWLRAMHLLHVGSRPDALPCREEEYVRVLRSVSELLEEGSGGCIYISGVPGTGKTATVHAIVRELKRMAECNETNPFTYVEINGLKIPEPSAAYNLLWEAVSGHDAEKEGHLRIGTKESLRALTRYFSGGGGRGRGPAGHGCVVLMDELDQLVTAKQDVVYNFFNWPTLVGSKLVVLAVANTMDLPERVMTGRVRSRLGMIRINFQPYTTLQLEKIVQARLLSAKEGLKTEEVQDVIAPDGIKFAAMKVSSISGDARRVLDICRRTVELVLPRRRTARTEDVKEVIKVMQNSPTAAYLRECSFHERMMLASLIKCIKREGVEEIKLGEVQHQHLIYMNVLTSPSDPTRKPTPSELALVLDSLVASRAMLMEDGVAASRKAEGERRVILNLEQGEVERVLSEVGGQRWKNVFSG